MYIGNIRFSWSYLTSRGYIWWYDHSRWIFPIYTFQNVYIVPLTLTYTFFTSYSVKKIPHESFLLKANVISKHMCMDHHQCKIKGYFTPRVNLWGQSGFERLSESCLCKVTRFIKVHFTKVYSNKECELRRDPTIGLIWISHPLLKWTFVKWPLACFFLSALQDAALGNDFFRI